MKVLWIIHGGEVFGEKRAVASLMKGVRIDGWEAEAVSLTEGEHAKELLRQGTNVTMLKLRNSPGMHLARGKLGKFWQACLLCWHQVELIKPLRRIMRTSRTDIVHVLDKNILPAVGWAAYLERKICFWEMTAVVRDGYPFNFNRILYRGLCRIFRISPIANSHYTAGTLATPAFPVDVVYLGVDRQIFDPSRVYNVQRETLGIPRDAVVFAIISRFDPTKGQRLFLEAISRCANTNMHLLLVGAEPGNLELVKINALARDRGAANRVHIVPQTDQPEAYMAVADVIVSAMVDPEAFGLSTAEAMMMGKPVLAHALGGPAEIVADGTTGWHVKEPTIDAYVAAIKRAMGDRHRWSEMGRAARERAENMFSIEAQTARYRSVVISRIAQGSS